MLQKFSRLAALKKHEAWKCSRCMLATWQYCFTTLYCMKEIIESCNSPLRFSFNPNIALRCGSRKIVVQNVFLIGHYLVLPYELTNTLLTDNNESFFIFTTFYSPCTLPKLKGVVLCIHIFVQWTNKLYSKCYLGLSTFALKNFIKSTL